MKQEEYDDFLFIGSDTVEAPKKEAPRKKQHVKKSTKANTKFADYINFINVDKFLYIVCALFSVLSTLLFTFSQFILNLNVFWLSLFVILGFVCVAAGAVVTNRKLVIKYHDSEFYSKGSSATVLHLFIILLFPALVIGFFLFVINMFNSNLSILKSGILPFVLGIIFYVTMIASTFLQKLDYYIGRMDQMISRWFKKKK